MATAFVSHFTFENFWTRSQKLRKETVSFEYINLTALTSVRREQFGSQWKEFVKFNI